MILPKSKEFEYLLKSKQPLYVKEFEDFNPKTRQIIIKLFELFIENEIKMEKIRFRLQNTVTFNNLF